MPAAPAVDCTHRRRPPPPHLIAACHQLQARSSHTLTAIGSTLYLTGGEHAPRVPLGSDVYAYSLSDKAWRRLATTGTPPPLRNAHAAAAIGSDLYVFGGRCGIDIGEAALNDLWRLDTATATWHAVRLADGSPAPPPRSYAAATATAGKLYLFGGCGAGSTGRLNDLWEFDPTASAWRQLPSSDAIPGRGGPGFVAAEGALFVIAGFAGRETNDVHRFHLATEAWDCPNCFSCTGAAADAQQVPPEQQPACGHAAPVGLPPRSVCAVVAHGCGGCAHKGHVVVFGGEVDPSSERSAALC